MTSANVPLPPTGVDLNTWDALFRALDALAHLQPWQWLDETHLFGIHVPNDEEPTFVSIQGAHDETPAILLYPGREGWNAYWALIEFAAEAGTIPEDLALNVPMIVATWTDEDALTEYDQGLLHALDIQTPTPWGWPIFRSFRPGWAPWYLTPEEARKTTTILQQVYHVADDLGTQGGEILLRALEQGRLLIRAPRPTGETVVWRNEWHPLPDEPTEPYRVRIPADVLDQLRQRIPNREEIQVDLFMLPTSIQEAPDQRPYIPYVLLLVDVERETVVAADMLDAREGVRHLFEHLPRHIVRHLLKAEIRPARLRVRSERLYALLEPLAQELTLELQRSSKLPPLDTVRVHLLERVVKAGEHTVDGTSFQLLP